MKDGILYSGLTVYGDYAPHTAMIRSFSMGNNFPTQYPHYGGADVKYHFMFQFLAGNLEYLGMRMDVAYNIVSLTSLTGFLMLLYQLALRITGKMCCGVLTIFLFFFRSGMAFFRFVWEHIQAGNLLETLTENVSFIGYTTNENWGLWNFNVYLNQRHLAFGLLMVTLALYLFMDWLEAGTMHEEKGFVWMKKRLFSKEGWRSRNLEQALLMGLFLGLCAFWNGAAVIGGLLILCGFAVFSDGKLDYLIMAAVTIFFSYLQTKIFISGSAMSPQIYLGFLAEDKTVWGVVKYLFWMSGVFFLGLLVLVWFMRRRERAILLGFIFPTIFAFVLLMTPDINVNHKYIMISYAFLTIFWAWTICNLWTGERVNRNVQIADERKTEDIENEIKKETSQSDVKTGRDRKIRKFAGKVLAAMRNLLGGKGAGLAEMTNIGVPIPQGFTITTEACTLYYDSGKTLPDYLIKAHLAKFLAPSSLLRLIGSLVFNHRKCRVIDLILKVPIILFRQCLKISKSLFTGINCHNEMEKRIQLCFVFER